MAQEYIPEEGKATAWSQLAGIAEIGGGHGGQKQGRFGDHQIVI